jgi:hypothetical protein
MNLTDWVPTGDQARAFRKLQNEVQVSWYTHPVNAAREARGQAPVNAIWPWGGASVAAEHAQMLVAAPPASWRRAGGVQTWAAPGWLTALADQRWTPFRHRRKLTDADHMPTAAACWCAAMPPRRPSRPTGTAGCSRCSALEEALFAPLLAP